MKILFYRYNSICEPDVIEAFQKLGITVLEEKSRMTDKNMTDLQTVEIIEGLIRADHFLFIFSINFFPIISEVCEVAQIPYVSWTVDVPVIELFSPALANKCNRIFMFDREQYQKFKAENPEGIFYMPLATNTKRWDKIIGRSTSAERKKFKGNVSFVGSLYTEKNAYKKIIGMSDYSKGYISGVIEAQLQIYGMNFIESMLTDELMQELDPLVPDLHQPVCEGNVRAQRYLIANSFIGSEIAETERIRILDALSERFDVDLYTFSETSKLPKVRKHGPVKTTTEMPLVFHESTVNLNITMRPIASGLSLRIYDVCGSGGFLLTNWQEELPEIYEPGEEVEFFGSQEELIEKTDFYLRHEEERIKIKSRGYERTVNEHTYDRRIMEMIKIINTTI